MKKPLRGQHLVAGGLGDIVRSLRTIEGITQAMLAEASGLSRSSIANIEAGRQGVSVDQMVLLLRMIGYDIKLEVQRVGR